MAYVDTIRKITADKKAKLLQEHLADVEASRNKLRSLYEAQEQAEKNRAGSDYIFAKNMIQNVAENGDDSCYIDVYKHIPDPGRSFNTYANELKRLLEEDGFEIQECLSKEPCRDRSSDVNYYHTLKFLVRW